MGRPKTESLTDHELTIIKILWDESPLCIAEILQRFPRKPKPAYTSLLTVVGAMEKKGYVAHVQGGKAYLYSPSIKKKEYEHSQIEKLVEKFFDGDSLSLAVNLIKRERLNAREIERLKRMLGEL